jgi:hypothetical protein
MPGDGLGRYRLDDRRHQAFILVVLKSRRALCDLLLLVNSSGVRCRALGSEVSLDLQGHEAGGAKGGL